MTHSPNRQWTAWGLLAALVALSGCLTVAQQQPGEGDLGADVEASDVPGHDAPGSGDVPDAAPFDADIVDEVGEGVADDAADDVADDAHLPDALLLDGVDDGVDDGVEDAVLGPPEDGAGDAFEDAADDTSTEDGLDHLADTDEDVGGGGALPDATEPDLWVDDADDDGAAQDADPMPDPGHDAAPDAGYDDLGPSDPDLEIVEGCVPLGIETCNGLDDDCDGLTDEEDALDCLDHYWDKDGDGFGADEGPDGVVARCLCEADDLWRALEPGDCDDMDPDVHPDAVEACNGIDDDCDGVTDPPEASLGAKYYFRDADGDGWGATDQKKLACGPTPLFPVTLSGDCCDSDDRVYPGQTSWFAELNLCGTFDYDCSGTAEAEWLAQGSCGLLSGGLCSGPSGWADSPPACGVESTWIARCQFLLACYPETEQRIQRCH